MDRKQKLLVGLIALLGLALAYRLTHPFDQGTVDRLTYARATKVAAAQAEGDASAQGVVRLDLLQSPPEVGVAVQRDLFRPPTDKRSVDTDEMQATEPEPEPPPRTARQMIEEHFESFKIFGSYRRGENIYLFLVRGKQVLIVTRGDRIDGKYGITDLDEKSATITAQELATPLKISFDEL
jgi:Tfp pilus assembly protein PilP